MPEITNDIREIELDEMWHFLGSKRTKKWSFKAVDRKSRKTIAWVTGNRDVATFKKLYKQIKH